VEPSGRLATCVRPPPLLSAGQVLKLELTDWLAPEMVSVAEQVCDPVPKGGATPVSFTVNCQVVPPGLSTALLARFMLKLPFTSVEPRWKALTAHGVLLWPLQGGGIVGVTPLGRSCAWTAAFEYGRPLVSFTVPVTVVTFCALTGVIQYKSTSNANRAWHVLLTSAPPRWLNI